jgi:hypothetical protein
MRRGRRERSSRRAALRRSAEQRFASNDAPARAERRGLSASANPTAARTENSAANLQTSFKALARPATCAQRLPFVGRPREWSAQAANTVVDEVAIRTGLADVPFFTVEVDAVADGEGLAKALQRRYDLLLDVMLRAATDSRSATSAVDRAQPIIMLTRRRATRTS